MLNPKIILVLFNQVNFFYIAPYEHFTCLAFLSYINVDKIRVRITIHSSWLIYLLNLGTCMEHLRQWTKEARSSLKLLVKLQVKMASGRRACRKQASVLKNASFLSKGAL